MSEITLFDELKNIVFLDPDKRVLSPTAKKAGETSNWSKQSSLVRLRKELCVVSRKGSGQAPEGELPLGPMFFKCLQRKPLQRAICPFGNGECPLTAGIEKVRKVKRPKPKRDLFQDWVSGRLIGHYGKGEPHHIPLAMFQTFTLFGIDDQNGNIARRKDLPEVIEIRKDTVLRLMDFPEPTVSRMANESKRQIKGPRPLLRAVVDGVLRNDTGYVNLFGEPHITPAIIVNEYTDLGEMGLHMFSAAMMRSLNIKLASK